jgi:2-methylisocitrate lyase-like PEP mutase family enzyme
LGVRGITEKPSERARLPSIQEADETTYPREVEMGQTRVHRILNQVGALAFPGVFDTLSARLAERAGFPMAFVSGYSVAATAIGEPDMGLLTQTEMIDRARRICLSVPIPIIVDADTGYGNPLNVRRTVQELIAAGAAGCFLEDQVWPKKCGHMRGKRVIDRGDYLQKIRAAVEAREGRDFFIVARTDALAVAGLDEAIARVEAAREAGADASFVEAPGSREDLEAIGGRRSPAPNVANMIEGGRTPVLPKQELAALGFQMILYPLAGLFTAARAMEAVYRALKEDGTTLGEQSRLMTFAEFNALIGVAEKYALAERYGADS